MRLFIIVLCLALLAAANSFADVQGDGALLYRGSYVQGFSPNGLYSTATGANATMHDLTNFLAWGVYCASDCKGRLMPTAAKGAYPQFTIVGGNWTVFVKNVATPFVNISSASGATHEWQQQ